jgi:hypothetical protein
MTRNKLITFCYLFIVGIGLAMAFPVGPEALGPLWTATAALGLLTVAGFMAAHRLRKPVADELAAYGVSEPINRWQVGLWILVILTALTFGYVRYIAMIQSPDQANQEVRLRLVGRLEALQPVPDADGRPSMDADGRWMFTQYNLDQESQEIVIPAGTPARWETLIEQPFTHLDRVELVGAPAGTAQIGVYQPENTVGLFARRGRNVVPSGVLGRLPGDPWVYSFKTVLSITPDYIQYQPGGPYLPVDRQTIRLTVDPATPEYERYARSDAYGYDVALTGELQAAAHAATCSASWSAAAPRKP